MTMQAFTPFKSVHIRPAFWGLDRDFKEVVDQIENTWSGRSTNTYEVKETEKAFLVSIDMPGVNKKDLEVHAEDKVLAITAIRRNPFANEVEETDVKGKKVSHSVRIPDSVDREKIQARCEDGVLYLALPKKEQVKAKKIDVTDGQDNSSWGNLLDGDTTP